VRGYLYIGKKITDLGGFWKPTSQLVCVLDGQTMPFQKLHNQANERGEKLLLEPPDLDWIPLDVLLQVEAVEIEYIDRPSHTHPLPIYNVYCIIVGRDKISAKRISKLVKDYWAQKEASEKGVEKVASIPKNPHKGDSRSSTSRVLKGAKKVRKGRTGPKPKESRPKATRKAAGPGKRNLICKKHKSYKAIRAPKKTVSSPRGCSQCWKVYYDKNPEKKNT